jgi:uncharacterized protein (DUF1800 family)
MRLSNTLAALLLPVAVTAQTTAHVDHRELPADQQVIQALNRLTFGPRPGDAQKVRAMGLDKWIELQLHPEKIDNTSLDQFVEHYSVLNQDQNEILGQYVVALRERRMTRRDRADSAQVTAEEREAQQKIQQARRGFMSQLVSERVARAVASNRQLEEVMTDFWLNHFNVFAGKGPPQPYYLVEYEREVIRPNALGKFRNLLGAVAKSPAMLFYLDNARSMADSTRPHLGNPGRFGGLDAIARVREMAPRQQQLRNGGLNENYGRELLELHTVGVDGGYTQQDVINVARALTGWTIQPPQMGGGFIFRPQMHDAGEKVVLGHKLAAGRGIEDGEDVLDIVARSPQTAKFIATKLARRFISDNPPQTVINDAAQIFMKTDGDIREVVRTIITSNEFYSQAAFRSKVKSPFEVVVSAMRALNSQPDTTPRTALAIAYLGEPIFGHQAPNGYPETGDAWMNTGAILNRINFGMAVAANRLPGVSFASLPALDTLQNASRAAQVDAVISILLSGAASADTRAVLMKGENPLASTIVPDQPNMIAQADGQMEPMNGATPARRNQRNGANGGVGPGGQRPNQGARVLGPVPQLSGIAQIVGLALGSPEFQRR